MLITKELVKMATIIIIAKSLDDHYLKKYYDPSNINFGSGGCNFSDEEFYVYNLLYMMLMIKKIIPDS